jgi:hypothetical protein
MGRVQMGNVRTGEFSESARTPAVLAVVLDVWWKVAATPGDLVDVLVATAGAGLLMGALPGRRISRCDIIQQAGGTDGLERD